MKKNTTLLIFILLALSTGQLVAQVEFASGFIVDRDGQRITCEILDKGWRSTPDKIKYRLTTEGDTKTATVADLNGFGVDDCCRFVRYLGDVDKSSDELGALNRSRNPEWVTDSIFLEVLLEGKASLYRWRTGNTDKFFFQVDNDSIQPLVYKRFKSSATQVGSNTFFRYQLRKALECEGLKTQGLRTLAYQERALTNYLLAYNHCQGDPSSDYVKARTPLKIGLSIRPGITLNRTALYNTLNNFRDVDYGSYNSYRIGLEAAFILPFGKRKWAILVEPSYQSVRETTLSTNSRQEADLVYESISIPLGFRYYSFLNNHLSLFMDAGFALNSDLNNEVNYETLNSTLELRDAGSPFVGVGGRYRSLGVEVRYVPFIILTSDYTFWRTDFQRIEIIASYTLFN